MVTWPLPVIFTQTLGLSLLPEVNRRPVLSQASDLSRNQTAIGTGRRIRYSADMTTEPARFFERRADVCGGEPVVKGTRVTVRTVLASLAEGATIEEILADFPTLTEAAVRAVIAFAAASAEEDLPVPAAPVPA